MQRITTFINEKNLDGLNEFLSQHEVSAPDCETIISLATKSTSAVFSGIVNHAKIKPYLGYINPVTGNNLILDIIINNIDLRPPAGQHERYQLNINIIRYMIQMLLQADTAHMFDINLQNKNGQNAVQILFNRLDITHKNSINYSAFSDVVKALTQFENLDLTCTVEAKNGAKLTPLMIAAKHSYAVFDVVLHAAGVLNHINDLTNKNETALHFAVGSHFSLRTVMALINTNTCELNLPNADGLTPLMLAAIKNDENLFVKILNQLILRGMTHRMITADATFQRLLKSNQFSAEINAVIQVFTKPADIISEAPPVIAAPQPAAAPSLVMTQEHEAPAQLPVLRISLQAIKAAKELRAAEALRAANEAQAAEELRLADANMRLLAALADTEEHLPVDDEMMPSSRRPATKRSSSSSSSSAMFSSSSSSSSSAMFYKPVAVPAPVPVPARVSTFALVPQRAAAKAAARATAEIVGIYDDESTDATIDEFETPQPKRTKNPGKRR